MFCIMLLMRNDKRSFGAISDEKGIYLVLTALLSLPIMGILVGLTLELSMARHARQELNLKLDMLCQQAAINLPIHNRVADSIDDLHDEFFSGEVQLKYATISSFNIILGTMPDGSISGYLFAPEMECDDGPEPFDPPLPVPTPPPNFVFDVCKAEEGEEEGGVYPVGFWNRINDSGAMIACEAEATVKSFFPIWELEKATVSARSVWWRSVRGRGRVYDPGLTGGVGPAVVVAIAPQLHTKSSESIFSFQDTEEHFDPLEDSLLYSFNHHAVQTPHGTLAELPSLDGVDIENRDDMLVASLNPPLLVRNAFTSTLLELLSRSGETRNRTELLILNSKHIGDDAPLRNYPVRIVGFGDDLTDDRYQPPYLVHFNNGWLDPFTSVPGTAFTSQLRLPFHFYHDGDDAVTRYPSGFNTNSAFEYPNYEFREALRGPFESSSDNSWDMPCAWGVFDIDGYPVCDPDSDGPPYDPKLTAAEVVHMLGSAQLCPSAAFGCVKPDSWRLDLKPDVSALRDYVLGGEALKAPGLFGFDVDGAHAPNPDSSSGDLVSYSPSQGSIVILILHDLPTQGTPAALDENTRRALQDLSSPPNRLHVVYIPSRPEGYAAICPIQQAMGLVCESQRPPGGNTFTLIGAGMTGSSPPNEASMISYWSEVLESDDEASVKQLAINFYKQILTTVIRRL